MSAGRTAAAVADNRVADCYRAVSVNSAAVCRCRVDRVKADGGVSNRQNALSAVPDAAAVSRRRTACRQSRRRRVDSDGRIAYSHRSVVGNSAAVSRRFTQRIIGTDRRIGQSRHSGIRDTAAARRAEIDYLRGIIFDRGSSQSQCAAVGNAAAADNAAGRTRINSGVVGYHNV